LAFVSGFLVGGFNPLRGAVAAAGVAAVAAMLLPRVTRGARGQGNGNMVPAIAAYVAVIGLMVVSAAASRRPLAALPAALFLLSDALIGLRRFVGPRAWMPLTIIVTYHLAQAGLVVWLAL
ncbi:MAG: lysoplasmalogenase, partial [Candidatus Dormibacteraeota bacterium]|nr:lysoplasmalogenase [Candidatus Dormibacteraeota bacterium]